jgi:hypothetical protein
MHTIKVIQAPKQFWRKVPFAVITHKAFDPCIMGCIIANVLFMVGPGRYRLTRRPPRVVLGAQGDM